MNDQNSHCYVCDKSEHQVKKLSASPAWFICNECVEECYQFLAEKRAKRIEETSAHEGSSHKTAPPDKYVHTLLKRFFYPLRPEELVTSSRMFPSRMRADLQLALQELLGPEEPANGFYGIHFHYHHETVTFATLLQDDQYAPVIAPAQYAEIDIGEALPIRCLENGLWLRQEQMSKFAVVLSQNREYGIRQGVHLEIVVPAGTDGQALTRCYFERLEAIVQQASSYRGKILSLEADKHYSGLAGEITVHKLPVVRKEDIILPQITLRLLERNILTFVKQRAKFAELDMSVKRGILFYGPPGTGKTYTIQYLAGELTDHTILLITAEQMGLLSDYLHLARLLQPAIVVIEDVDLIAKDRAMMESPCEESLLNRLLNEMDGLREDASIIFILTTNRPDTLESALIARPGRIDQAIEFSLPDEDSRRRLITLYSRGIPISEDVVRHTARKTDNVSPAFIKELMRKAAQYYIEDTESSQFTAHHIDLALEEMLFRGGTLNVKLLGGDISALEQEM